MAEQQHIKTFTEMFKDQDDVDIEVSTTQFLGFRGVTLQTKLIRLVMPLFSGVKSMSGGLKNMDLDTEVMVKHLLTNATESKVQDIIKDLVASTTVDNKDLSSKANFDLLIAGNYQMLFEIIRWVIDVNNFFGKDGIGGMIANIEKMPLPQGFGNSQDSLMTK